MNPFVLQREQVIPLPIEEAFTFFADAGNLETITPPWLHFRIITPETITMRAGTLIEYQLRWRWVPVHWLTEIKLWNPPVSFVDVQLKGPYRLWEHEHTFATCQAGTLMRDVVRYALPFGPVGRLAHRWFLHADLNRIFDFRARQVASLLGKLTPGTG